MTTTGTKAFFDPAGSPDAPFVSAPCQVVATEVFGSRIFFAVGNPKDFIQREQVAGKFYEEEELEIIRRHFPPGGVFCDIGANTGNHTLFVLKFLHASHAVVFEPNPPAFELLRTNMYLNGVEGRCDMRHLGIGVGARRLEGASISWKARNLGSGKIAPEGGDLTVERGDAMLEAPLPDFVKIDVEGMELDVLDGLSGTLATARPKLFAEVDNRNREAFDTWVGANGYVQVEAFKRYPANENLLLVAKEKL